MNTTELFNFHFVDRDIEQENLNKFLSDSSTNTLWIKGERGFGKTKFFRYVLGGHKEYTLCYIDIKINENSVDIVSDFIIELQKICDIDFIATVKKKYKQFYNKTYKRTKNITDELFPQISSIVSIILDLGYYAVTHSNKNENPLDIIKNYIQQIIHKKRLCICIDNFSRCDIETARFFFCVFKYFYNENKLKSCIITTSEDMSIELQEEIHHQLPYIDIKIDQFDAFDYFYQIMEPIFEMDYFSKDDIEYLYKKCHGSPKRLSTLISKLLEKNGITLYSNKKAIIDKKIMFSILQTDHIKFDDSDFSSQQKWILFSYLCLKEQTSVFQLKNLALYISQKFFLYHAYDEKVFNEELLTLINNRILDYDDKNEIISTYHDLDYIEMWEIFYNSQLKGLFSEYAYEFLLQNSEHSYREELLCKNARNAKISGWEFLNFRYGKKLFYSNQIYEAQKQFSYLEDYLHKFHPMQILFIALVSYETGNYQLAINEFSLLASEELRFNKMKYYYYFYLAKSYNNIGKTEVAVDILEKALKVIPENSAEYVQTLNTLHMYCIEIPSRINQSKRIFNKIKTSYKDTYPVIWANTMRGCQNFLDDKTSLKILEEAELKLEDELQQGYLKTTKGFILVKLDRLYEAELQFNESCEIIKRLKIHEFSYAANDLAICYMIRKDYNMAKKILLEALFWNRTNYGELVIQTHLMVCSMHLSQNDETNYYYNVLKNYMNEHQVIDPVINRKIYLNLAIASRMLNDQNMANSYGKKASRFVKNSSSEWRLYQLFPYINTGYKDITPPTSKYLKITDFEPWFLIYAHD